VAPLCFPKLIQINYDLMLRTKYWRTLLTMYAILFYARQLCRQVLRRARISYGNYVRLSVCLSVTTRYGFNASWFQRCKVLPPRFKESSVRAHQIWVPPWKRAVSATVVQSSTRKVADRRRLAAHRNKHCWRAFQWYQHRWPSTTLNPPK